MTDKTPLTPQIWAKWHPKRREAWICKKEGYIDAIEADRAKMAVEVASIRSQLARYRKIEAEEHKIDAKYVIDMWRRQDAETRAQIEDRWRKLTAAGPADTWAIRTPVLQGMFDIKQEEALKAEAERRAALEQAGRRYATGGWVTGAGYRGSRTPFSVEESGYPEFTREQWLGAGQPPWLISCQSVLHPDVWTVKESRLFEGGKFACGRMPGHTGLHVGRQFTNDEVVYTHEWDDTNALGYAR